VTEIQVTVDPNPVIETGVSEIHAIVQVEAQPAFANDNVFIYSQQLVNSCEAGSVEFRVNEGTDLSVPQGGSATVALDNDGNATVEVDASECAPRDQPVRGRPGGGAVLHRRHHADGCAAERDHCWSHGVPEP
jgi:hypothetical protein